VPDVGLVCRIKKLKDVHLNLKKDMTSSLIASYERVLKVS
jgi:hypothetical protein